VNTSATDQPDACGWYEIRLRGRLHSRWSTMFDGMALSYEADGTTVLRGPVPDQPALHGLLGRLRDIGLPLVSIAPVQPGPADPTGPAA
jgi:hypothetical protein